MISRLERASTLAAVVVAILTVAAGAQTGPQGGASQPPRDQPGQRATTAPEPRGRIAGRVLTADTGQPVRRARVFVSATELPGGRAVFTSDEGTYEFTGLPAGRYSVNVSKASFITISYGQRRPLQPGTPLQLGTDQELTGVDFRLPQGSVIAGHVFDETGSPLPGANVQVLAYRYAQGNRQLVPSGGGQTDDRGAFRVWGLNPGEYYVSAMARDAGGRGVQVQIVNEAGGRGRGAGRGAVNIPLPGTGPGPDRDDAVQYAPTFYPGVPSESEARAVTVGLSAEVLDVNFSVLMVRTAQVSGRVVTPAGAPSTVNVVLFSEGDARLGGAKGGRVRNDGSFTISNVTPGRYILRVQGGSNEAPLFASQPLTIGDGDLADLVVVLAPGASVAGTVAFQGSGGTQAPDASQVRIVAQPLEFTEMGASRPARANRDGTFTLDGVPTGPHFIRPQAPTRGWMLKSVTVAGRDYTDTPLDMTSGQRVTGVSIVFIDRLSEINGTLTDTSGTPITEYTVLAFPTDRTLWRPQARQIATTRPDQNGKYQIRGLPPGDYYLTTIDPQQAGEWFEPAFLDEQRNGASQLSLGEGDVKTKDFRLSR